MTIIGFVGLVIVAAIVAAPELLLILGGSPEPSYLMGKATFRVVAAFAIGALLAGGLGRGKGSFLVRLDVAALLVGFLLWLVQLRGQGVW